MDHGLSVHVNSYHAVVSSLIHELLGIFNFEIVSRAIASVRVKITDGTPSRSNEKR